MNELVYAPILIPTLCRNEHFIRCVESLKRNTWAKYTDIYIALDYPLKKEHWDGYNKIYDYLQGDFSEFASFNVIIRDENYGAPKNMRELLRLVMENHDRFIRTDDDCEFSENFIEYMDKCLALYKNDENVVAVTGYSHPVKWDVDEEYNAFKSPLMCPMWGTGFWNTKYLSLKEKIEKGCLRDSFISGKTNIKDLCRARYIDYIDGCLDYSKKSLIYKMTDIGLSVYIQLYRKTVITPVISKVRNHGFDGSGIYCLDIKHQEKNSKKTIGYDYDKQIIDKEKTFEPNVKECIDYVSNKKKYDSFDPRGKNRLLLVKAKHLIYKIIGEKAYVNLWKVRNKNNL